MNIRTPLIRAALATALVGGGFALERVPANAATQAGITMSVDSQAPLHATLLPEVTVSARAAHPAQTTSHVASNDALSVTLLPTVHVTAGREAFAMLRAPFDDTLDVDASVSLLAAAD
jgi:hypothetical protein